MKIALYQPDIPQNTGSIMRLCACLGVACHIIGPCGFVFGEKQMKRAAMDYADQAQVVRHASWEAFAGNRAEGAPSRLILLTTKATANLYDFSFRPGDTLLLGRESAGVPDEVAASCDARLRLPIAPSTRSLNVALAAAMALSEALRQTGGLMREG